MGTVALHDLAMRKLGSTWFVKVIPRGLLFQLDGASACLWDSLLVNVNEQAAVEAFVAHYGGHPEARADAPELLTAFRANGLLYGLSQMVGPANTEWSHAEYISNGQGADSSVIQDVMYQKALALRQPLLVEYEMTYHCNLRCLYCYQPTQLKHERRDELTPDEISRMLDDFAGAGVFYLIVTGGECTLNRNFAHVVREARARLMDVSVLTNATSLKPATIELMASAPVSEVKVSIYGSNGSQYGAFTGFASAYQKVMDNLVKLRQSGVRVIAKVIVTSMQKDTFRDSLAQLKELGIESEVSAHVMPAMDGATYPLQYRLDTTTLTTLFKERRIRVAAGRACTAGTVKFRVDPEGFVNACELQRTPLGNIRKQRILDILSAQVNTELVGTLVSAGRRAQNNAATKALPCPALGKLEHGSWEEPAVEAVRWTAAADSAELSMSVGQERMELIRGVVYTEVEQHLGVSCAGLPDTQKFSESPIGMDSLDFMEFLMHVSARLDIDVPSDERLDGLMTIGGMVSRLCQLLDDNALGVST